MARKRDRLQIIYDILRAIEERDGKIRTTHILYKSNLSHILLEEYLSDLLSKGFIEVHHAKDRKTYSLTQKGFDYINRYKLIMEFTSSFGLE